MNETAVEETQQQLLSWFLAQSFTGVHIFIEMYILLSLVFFGLRTNKLCAPWNRSITILLLIGISTPLIHLLNISFTETLLITNLSSNISYNTQAANVACNTILRLKLFTNAFAFTPAFVFLWYRHRTIYRSLSLSNQKHQIMGVVSGISMTLLLVCLAFILKLIINGKSYISSPYGCVIQPDLKSNYQTLEIVAAILYFVSWIIMSLLLVCLLISVKGTREETSREVRKVIKKAVISLLFCVLSNVLALFLSGVVVQHSLPSYVTYTYLKCVLFDFSLTVDSLFIVLSYLGHRNILFGWLPWVANSSQCLDRGSLSTE